MANILLVQPPEYRRYYNQNPDYKRYFSRELGLLQIASFLKQNNINVKIIPGFYRKQEFFDILKKELKNTDILGTSCLTPEYNIALDILKFAKNINKNIKTVLGGYHATWMGKEILKDTDCVDIIVRGEGEQTFLDIAQNKDKKEIRGITFKDKTKIVKTEDQIPIKEIPELDSELIKEYNKKIENSEIEFFQFDYLSTRGCPHNCSFCTENKFWGCKTRFKPISSVKKEIDLILENKKCKRIFFMDSNFTINKNYLKEFCKTIENKQASFKCYTRIDNYPKETAIMLKKAGFDVIHFGVEHFDKEVQKEMNKVVDLKTIERSLKNAKKAGQYTGIYILIGLPGDNFEKSKNNYDIIYQLYKEKLLDELVPMIFIPYPGTDHFNNPEKYGITISTKDFSQFTRTKKPIISYKKFTSEEIQSMFNLFADLSYQMSLKNPYTSLYSD
jgi:radical SAM superfamily enzyme YgiQ (UPF0313 family)